MSETAFRLLEVIAILLPLTGIFLQMSTRVLDEISSGFDETDVRTIQSLLLVAGVILATTAMLVSITLSLSDQLLRYRAVYLLMYVAFLCMTIALGFVSVAVHPNISVTGRQQDLTESTEKDADNGGS